MGVCSWCSIGALRWVKRVIVPEERGVVGVRVVVVVKRYHASSDSKSGLHSFDLCFAVLLLLALALAVELRLSLRRLPRGDGQDHLLLHVTLPIERDAPPHIAREGEG